MSNTYILPAVVFALVAGMGTVLSKWTAPSFPPPSIEDAPVASIAAAKTLTAVHNNVRLLVISCLLCFSSRFSRLADIICRFLEGFKTMTSLEGRNSVAGTSCRFAAMQRFVGYRRQGGLGQSARSAHL